jgi:hypothetical protein
MIPQNRFQALGHWSAVLFSLTRIPWRTRWRCECFEEQYTEAPTLQSWLSTNIHDAPISKASLQPPGRGHAVRTLGSLRFPVTDSTLYLITFPLECVMSSEEENLPSQKATWMPASCRLIQADCRAVIGVQVIPGSAMAHMQMDSNGNSAEGFTGIPQKLTSGL